MTRITQLPGLLPRSKLTTTPIPLSMVIRIEMIVIIIIDILIWVRVVITFATSNGVTFAERAET